MPFGGRGILLDIEGTTSSLRFVHDVMFPFVRRDLDHALRDAAGTSTPLREAILALARDAGHPDLEAWQAASAAESATSLVRAEVLRLMDGDVKSTGLKQLQGLIWESGFRSGELRAHVYDDVPAALEAWTRAGVDVRVFSSGSAHAQRLYFSHTTHGNLLPAFRGHYDTTTGPKREPRSYAAIAGAWGLEPGQLLFCSDVVEELDAARTAGFRTALVRRPGNPDPPPAHGHDTITTLTAIAVGPTA